MKRAILIALILSIFYGSASCADNPDGSDLAKAPETSQNSEGITSDETETEPVLPEGLDFEGTTVNILCRTGDMLEWTNEMFVETDDGDIVNSAVYERNRSVEELLNIEFNFIERDGNYDKAQEFMNTIRSSINAGDNEFDLIAGYRHFMPQLAVEGYFYNLNNVPYLNFDQPWWKGNFTSELTIDGKLHFMAGDIGNSMLKCMLVMFYNKDLAADWKLEDIYDIVLDGRWTIDKAIELSQTVSQDLNGDSQLDMENDLFSFCTNHVQEYFDVFANSFTSIGDSGFPEFSFNNEKSVDIVNKLYKLLYEAGGAVPYDMSTSVSWAEGLELFVENRLLIWSHCLGYAESMRDMENDFAVIPYFKWDESQSEYLTATQNNFSILSIAVNCQNIEAVGAATEALAAESYRTVTPAYYEIALGTKYTRDELSKQMLEIIRNGVTFNFGTVYSIQLNNIYSVMADIMSQKSTDFTSYYASHESQWQNSLDAIITAYKELD